MLITFAPHSARPLRFQAASAIATELRPVACVPKCVYVQRTKSDPDQSVRPMHIRTLREWWPCLCWTKCSSHWAKYARDASKCE